MKYGTDILQAQASAPWKSDYHPVRDFRDYADKPDDTPLCPQPLADIKKRQTKGLIIVPNLQELRTLCREYIELADTDTSAEWLDRALKHEDRHRQAAKKLGAKVTGFGLQAVKYKHYAETCYDFRPELLIPDFTTTKLGFALILMHPEKPSQSDSRVAFDELKYPNLQTLKRLAKERGMPVPRGN